MSVFVFLSTSEVQDLGLGCFAGGSACREQGPPLLPGSRVLHFAELFENRFFFACRSLRIRGTGRDLWQDSHEITFDSAQDKIASIILRICKNSRKNQKEKEEKIRSKIDEFLLKY